MRYARSTTTGFAPQWSTTPQAATTTRRRIRPGSSRPIYTYHSNTLGWCDIAYNALVDKYGQVFEGSAGGITKAGRGFHTGGFNRDTWGVAMIGNFDDVPPTRSSSAPSAGCSAGGWAWTASTPRAR